MRQMCFGHCGRSEAAKRGCGHALSALRVKHLHTHTLVFHVVRAKFIVIEIQLQN